MRLACFAVTYALQGGSNRGEGARVYVGGGGVVLCRGGRGPPPLKRDTLLEEKEGF